MLAQAIRVAVLRRVALIALLTTGCAADPEETEPECVEVPASCNPLYPPTFANVFDNTLLPTCGSDAGSCHGPNARQAGLLFAEASESHALLLGERDGRARVKPGDPSCSKLIVRTHSLGKPWQMPPGEPLSGPERCAIAEWVRSGAERN